MNKNHGSPYRKALLASLFSIIMLSSMVINVSLITSDNLMKDNITGDFLSSASTDLETPWVGVGNNRTVKTYLKNSSTVIDQENYFNVSVDTTPSEIDSGNFNFTFASEYNTNHTFEMDSPLIYSYGNVSSRSNPNWVASNTTGTDNIYREAGTPTGGDVEYMMDEDFETRYRIDSVDDGENYVINITYTANFSSISNFDPIEMIGFRLRINSMVDEDVNVSVYGYNTVSDEFDLLSSENEWTADSQSNYFLYIPNTNIQYFTATNTSQIKISLIQPEDSFEANFYDFKVDAVKALERSITDSNFVAMEFDLKGNATVSGFNAWIRTLDTNPESANLTISLYRANQTSGRESEDPIFDLDYIAMEPGNLISTRNITDYTGDEIAYFSFKEDGSPITDLNVSNYFVVLSTNISEPVYSITLLASEKGGTVSDDVYIDPDTSDDHLLLRSEQGLSGSWTRILLDSKYPVDVAPFYVNITRAWVPDEEISIKIEETVISSVSVTDGIYEETSGLYWGLGEWSGEFVNKTRDELNNINVSLSWNTNISDSISFSVDYDVVVYSVENATTVFNVTYDEKPNWELNYTFDASDYPNWELDKVEYVLPLDYGFGTDPAEIYGPDLSDITINMTGPYMENNMNVYTLGNETFDLLGNGNYTLICNSTNYMETMSTGLKYNDNIWATNGFMPGDNITVSCIIINGTSTTTTVSDGTATCEMYDLDGSLVSAATLTDDSYDGTTVSDKAYTYYEFDKEVLWETDWNSEKGAYSLLFKWTNGDEIGFGIHEYYVTDYTTVINEMEVDEDRETNLINAYVSRNESDSTGYSYEIFAINKTSSTYEPSEPYLNLTLGYDYADFKVNVTRILVNETLINPGEEIEVTLYVENYNEYFGNDVKFDVEFVQAINNNWVAFNGTTNEVSLDVLGSGNEEGSVTVTLTVPDDYQGTNAPIRLNPLYLYIAPVINDVSKASIPIENVFPLVNYTESQFEGNVLGYEDNLSGSGPSIIGETNRSESILPGTTNYLIQLHDSYYVSTNTTNVYEFNSKVLTEITDISSESNLIWGKSFNLTGTLVDEFGEVIGSEDVSVSYWDGSSWLAFNVLDGSDNELTTNSLGEFNGIFDSTQITKSADFGIKVSYAGDSNYFASENNVTLVPIEYSNEIEITMLNSSDTASLKKGESNIVSFQITNTGNSTLIDLDFEFEFEGVTYTLNDLGLNDDNQLAPNEQITLEYQFDLPSNYNGEAAEFNLTISGESLESEESLQLEEEFSLELIESSFFDNLTQNLIIIFLVAVAGFIIFTVFYSMKMNKKLNEVPEEVEEGKPRRGRYVKVSELSKKKEDDKNEPSEADKKKSADLDDLLAEEGLDEEKE